MKKFALISALLGFQLTTKKPLLGGEPVATLKEEDFGKIENEMERLQNQDFQGQLDQAELDRQDLEKQLNQANADKDALQTAVTTALEQNGIESKGNDYDDILALGDKCKEYGASQNRHTFPSNDGKQADPSNEDGLIDGVFNPNDRHNQID